MDTTTRIITREKISTDTKTGLDLFAETTSLSINGENNGLITVGGRLAILSPTLVCVEIVSLFTYIRYDRAETKKEELQIIVPEVLYVADEIMVPAVLNEFDEVITPAVLAIGGEIKQNSVTQTILVTDKPANNKYSQLADSILGKGIEQMLHADLVNAIAGGVFNSLSLVQN